MTKKFHRLTLFAILAGLLLVFAGCDQTTATGATTGTTGSNAGGGPGATGGTSSAGGMSSTGGTDSTGTTGDTPVAVSLSEDSFTLDTPDLSHTLKATVTGTATATVTWSSSNTYVATVTPAGVVTSVSGGQATITATSTADATKTATAEVTVAEPNRAKASSYTDAKTITSGPINILMCGDSLMRTYTANTVDQTGWGQVLSQFFTSEVTVNNTFPNGGRSSRSFYNEVGRWNLVKSALAAAKTAGTPTFVFIMFGHNDEKKITDTDGADYLTFASNNQNGTVAGTYYDYLERYIVEARELGGIPVLFSPFVREYLAGTPGAVTPAGQHNIAAPYTGETTARGDYPAAVKAIASKHDVPVVDITAWSKAMVEAHAAEDTLSYVYISSDQTHVRSLGAMLMAQEAVRALNEQGILTSYAKKPAARVMLDAGTIPFSSVYSGDVLEKTFRITPFGDVTGTITVTAPPGYTVSTDGALFGSSAVIPCDSTYSGSVVTVRFSPTDSIAYNGDLTVSHTSLTPDYGNSAPNAVAGTISLTGNGKVAASGTPATATWAMYSGTTIVMDAVVAGAINATPATLTGLINKNVAYGAARFVTTSGNWVAESVRNEGTYVEFTLPVTLGTFTIDSISVDAGSGGGSNMRWDIAYSFAADFSSPTNLGTALSGVKDTLVTSSYPGLGVDAVAGQTLYLRVYPYNTSAATSGKSLMLANVVVSGVTN
jgi:lysophospholipase L1-like esterase